MKPLSTLGIALGAALALSQAVPAQFPTLALNAQNCPGGVCPLPTATFSQPSTINPSYDVWPQTLAYAPQPTRALPSADTYEPTPEPIAPAPRSIALEPVVTSTCHGQMFTQARSMPRAPVRARLFARTISRGCHGTAITRQRTVTRTPLFGRVFARRIRGCH